MIQRILIAAAVALSALSAGAGAAWAAEPVCVYNQAYQENYREDSLRRILRKAEGCYVLLDPFQIADAADSIQEIRAKGNQVGCYMSSGTGEDWRDDFDAIQPYLVDEEWGDWPGEYFVDRTEPGLVAAMRARIDRMRDWGCDWVEFDNMDWAFDDDYRADYGFGVTPEEAVSYNQNLCTYARDTGLRCMAKSTREGAENFDGVTFESYHNEKNWWDDDELQAFLDEDKLALVVHYKEKRCKRALRFYKRRYAGTPSFVCESRKQKRYRHYCVDEAKGRYKRCRGD